MASKKLTTSAAEQSSTTMNADPFLGSELQRFLLERRVMSGKGNEVSMTGMGAHKGSWMVTDEDYPTFLNLMDDFLNIKRCKTNNLVEQRKPDGMTPLLVDLDFRYASGRNLQRSFTSDAIHAFVMELVTVLKEYFDLKERPTLRFFVTLRPTPYQDPTKKDIKDGVHIVCPDFVLTTECQAFVRYKMLEREAVSQCFEGTDYINKDADVYDESLVKKNGWFFYGESKPTIPAYMLDSVYKYNPKTGKLTTDTTTYTSRELLELLSIRYKRKTPLGILATKQDEVEGVLASLRNPVVQVAVQPEKNLTDEAVGIVPMIVDSFNTTVMTDDEIALAVRLVDCLNAERAEGYDSWMRVGWCLRNIDPSETMFDVWMKFSEKSSKSNGNNTEQLRRDWIKGNMRSVNGSPGLRMGSLKMWAKNDNPVMYTNIMEGDIISFIQKTAITFKGGTHYHVAMMIYKLFPDIYKCSVDGRSTEWFEFKNHVWNPMPNGLQVKMNLTDYVDKKVDAARAALRQPEDKDPEYKDKLEKYFEAKAKHCRLQENLYNANFKDSVMKEAVQLFYDKDFARQINQNPYALGCANGVLQLRDTVFDEHGKPVRYKPTLYPGKAEDYISLRVGVTPNCAEPIAYVPYDPADPRQAELQDFFRKLFPDEELREYVLTLMAGCLEGANKEQCFYIMTGGGGNGKSKFVDLMTSTLGQYAGSLATTALTRKRPDSGAANPDIISVKGCRFIEMKEPDDHEPINSARMKQFSGEDYVEARGLFKDQERFRITGKIFLACNQLPPIHSMDGGTWRRVRVIPFKSKFVPKGDPIDPDNFVFPRDDMMEEKLKQWREPMFSLLVHYYETKYCPGGIQKVPAIVMEASERYKGDYDSLGKFVKARIRKIAGYDDPPTFTDIKKAYKNWMAEENPSGKKLSDNDLRNRLNELFQAPADGKTYKHLRLFGSDEEIQEYENMVAEGNA